MDIADLDRNALIVRHMTMARQKAGRYAGRGLPLDELECEAYAALCEAAAEYDPAEFPDSSFAAYAGRAIRWRIVSALRRASSDPLEQADERGMDGYGVMPAGDRPDLAPVVEELLGSCTELGRQCLVGFAVDGLTWLQLARRLKVPVARVRREHDSAARAITAECRRRGLTAEDWARAIA